MPLFSKKNLNNEHKAGNRHTVMLVDDEQNILSELGSFLEDDYRIVKATNGLEALELLRRMDDGRLPSLIICDQRMPEMTGIEFFEKVVEENLAPDTLRILLTGQVDFPVLLDAINKVFLYKFIYKPFEAEEFIKSVQDAVGVFEERKKRRERERELEKMVEELREENRELRARLADLTGGEEA